MTKPADFRPMEEDAKRAGIGLSTIAVGKGMRISPLLERLSRNTGAQGVPGGTVRPDTRPPVRGIGRASPGLRLLPGNPGRPGLERRRRWPRWTAWPC
ncbi:MAG: hypothetical protein M0C28_43625 [Candidatus Moduliflexus flocculans]|nr:hypothetical protein [Candidatus Moduliflexus flocculans]